ncbi:MAG: DNA-binding transcriptional regulator ModE [Firmicutes bacterium ADurb.Bin182]|nr:MAG: DNA-binding transcriptional regulator ModE [Firmicutes bacterium ADurb.Bin182]
MGSKLRLVMSLKIYREEKCFGPGVMRLLKLVEETNSLKAAAGAMEMAYSKAWSIVKNSESRLGFKLLDSTTGGRGGGGARLTQAGSKLLKDYCAFESESRSAVENIFEKYFGGYE